MGRKEDMVKKVVSLMENPEVIRNIGIVAHIHHGKTTISDNLLAAAGMISEELAGKQLYLNFDEQEQERCLTINSANVSMVHMYGGNECLINLIDTPGHVDFGGDVTRAMRAVDGAVVVVCAVEGVMAQTETVLRQALREKVKPVLFINKVDRAINELKLTPEMMMDRFVKIINDVNVLIDKMVPKEFKGKWNVRVDDGSVAFGSGYHKWAISAPQMKKTNITFRDIYDFCAQERQPELAKKAQLYECVFDMVVKHLPSPKEAQPYRVPQIWSGNMDEGIGKAMINCDSKGELSFMITDITVDEHAGEVATGRLYSGEIKKGTELSLAGTPYKNKVQQVSVYMGPERLTVDRLVAGNIAAVTGLKDAVAGTTASTNPDFTPFEEIHHISEPVVTVAIEAKHTKDLPKLVEVMREVAKEDPSLKVEINQETGEHLLAGMGELHIEITTYRIINDHNVDINISEPIVVYRETIDKKSSQIFEGKSPNKHNKFYVEVEPLSDDIVGAMLDGTIPSGKIKDAKALSQTLQEFGMSRDESKKVVAIDGTNMLIDVTRGIQYLNETMELVVDAFKEVINRGPLTNEPVRGMLVRLTDAKLHEDAIHRGPAQIIPAMRNAIYGAMLLARTMILEPKQKITLNVPGDIVGNGIQEIQGRRGIIEDMGQEGDLSTIVGKAPVSEMFGFAAAIRGATGGRCLWSTEQAGFEKLPPELQGKVVAEVRTRKGLKPEPPTPDYYAG